MGPIWCAIRAIPARTTLPWHHAKFPRMPHRGLPAEPESEFAPQHVVLPEAIFVSGVPRSGTTLVREILGKHSLVAIATENHYMGYLVPRPGARRLVVRWGDPHDDAAIQRMLDQLYRESTDNPFNRRGAFWKWIRRNVSRPVAEQDLLATDRSEAELYRAFLRMYARQLGKIVIGEKTPAHIAWAHELLAWYPTARAVHVLRDPRAVFTSELKRRTTGAVEPAYRLLARLPPVLHVWVAIHVAWTWNRAVGAHRNLAAGHPNRYMLLRFEDLVSDPDTRIPALCRWLGLEFEPEMMEQEVVSRGDHQGETGFDRGAVDRWRTRMLPRNERLICWLVGGRLTEMGYRR